MVFMLEVNLNEVVLQLYPEKLVYIPKYKTLVFTDVHLGKATHFRSKGIPFPNVASASFIVIHRIIQNLDVEKVIMLGDFFHSTLNTEWLLAEEFFSSLKQVELILVKGNHDILATDLYEKFGIQIVDFYHQDNIVYSHHPIEASENNFALNIHGHLHPGFKIFGKAKQTAVLPCYCFYNNKQFVLPAYGKLTGLMPIANKQKNNRVFVIHSGKVNELNFTGKKEIFNR